MRLACVTALLLAACKSSEEVRPTWAGGLELVYRQDFQDPGALDAFELTDPAVWHQGSRAGGAYLALEGGSSYEPPVRSPTSLALLKGRAFTDFVLEVEAQYTGREYGHSDLCLVFGYEGPARFYYVHLAPEPDDRAHNVFLVDGAPRRRVADVSSEGLAWEPGVWRRLRLERTGATVRVFVDDGPSPILEASDGTIAAGRVGLGSFDDAGCFRRLRVWQPHGSD